MMISLNLCANILEKGMNLFVLHSAMNKDDRMSF